jgi:hypothetical protein
MHKKNKINTAIIIVFLLSVMLCCFFKIKNYYNLNENKSIPKYLLSADNKELRFILNQNEYPIANIVACELVSDKSENDKNFSYIMRVYTIEKSNENSRMNLCISNDSNELIQSNNNSVLYREADYTSYVYNFEISANYLNKAKRIHIAQGDKKNILLSNTDLQLIRLSFEHLTNTGKSGIFHKSIEL